MRLKPPCREPNRPSYVRLALLSTPPSLRIRPYQVHDHKDDLDRLLRDLQQMKRRYFEQKRRDQLQREATARGDAMKDSTRERPKETKSAYAPRGSVGEGFRESTG